MTVEESVIYLASCAVNERPPSEELVSAMDLEEVYRFAGRHKISCCIATALAAGRAMDTRAAKMIAEAIRRDALFSRSLEEVREKLEAAGIWYVPLKGILLKEYYPKTYMREMADHDILIDAGRAGDVKDIMEELGFTTVRFGVHHHDVYHRPPVLNYEMHTSLFGPSHDPKLYNYYLGVRDLSRKEDFYLYLVAHEYKHYMRAGTGLRSLMDIYLFLKREDLDWDYVEENAKILGMGEFEKKNRRLSMSLFGGKTVTDEAMLSYILSSAAYGTLDHRVDNAIRKQGGGRLRYLLRRLSVPFLASDPRYRVFAGYYPFFYKHRILLPFLPVYRVVRAAAKGRLAPEWKSIWKHTGKKI